MSDPTIQLRLFESGDATAFRELNEAWIKRYFSLEQADYAILGDPVGHIIAPGGSVFMASADGEIIGCCALVFVKRGVYEVAKMAVAEQYRGRGIGRRLLVYVIEQARASGATLLTLATNDSLANAIHLYESLGFRHLPPEPSPFARANVFMELSLTQEATTD